MEIIWHKRLAKLRHRFWHLFSWRGRVFNWTKFPQCSLETFKIQNKGIMVLNKEFLFLNKEISEANISFMVIGIPQCLPWLTFEHGQCLCSFLKLSFRAHTTARFACSLVWTSLFPVQLFQLIICLTGAIGLVLFHGLFL